MTSQAQVTNAKTGLPDNPARVPLTVAKLRTVGFTGEMALQNIFGHPGTQSMQQGLVRLVGHRDLSRPVAADRTA